MGSVRDVKLPGLVLLFFLVAITALQSSAAESPRTPAQSAEQKFHYIHANGLRAHPDPRPTQLSEQEVNAYLASGKVRLPAGVQSVRLVGTPGVIQANCRIDFDAFRASRTNSSPLLHLFSGIHEVVVDAQASGSNYRGRVQVNSISIDGAEVPRFLLEMFVEKYVTPRYPGVGLDSTFALPDRIASAEVSTHALVVAQR
jgi:hypothetical protein